MKLYENSFQVLMALTMNITILWNVARCSLVEILQRFKQDFDSYFRVGFMISRFI
jgi:hypothetical protein